ncbi:3-oxoacyl-ACP reductase [Paraburkholderia ginsengiterrae]|uniref:3-oxoacyl-ACP reductase n=1 Tax=Paraburkholderia ginsengiterrae TaxID=1462993 RepID=A0A1A9N805_9BURK|nr:SDR family NAD(P)-dependent oxidoreductase [Paraburkholderia ginsengiterrae]OAJ51632.1 3-oxoacyl-ACP reductase [Paraburkholderia ginsengiterrae]OAJ61819.1 3-oxoacyl-ACP reductase [Paraburkholderia ginsengiterrae]
MSIRFDGKVAVITGAGAGLGRQHALAFAARGAKVVVNDFGGGSGSSAAAQAVSKEIREAGGTAIANGADVADYEQVQAMVAQAMREFGRVDILVNNAGILRDKSFSKMDMAEFRMVLDVHLMGSAHCSKAVWDIMREQNYGRIVMTTSAAGLYGNFGQANYGAAKLGLVGLMNVMHQEGYKKNIRVNTIAPVATTQMTAELLPEAVHAALQPERVTPAVLFLCSEDAPARTIVSAAGGSFAVAAMMETAPVHFASDALTPEAIAERFASIADWSSARSYESASQEIQQFITQVTGAA